MIDHHTRTGLSAGLLNDVLDVGHRKADVPDGSPQLVTGDASL
ncbi:hypothetical protein [Rhodococcus sp. BL-253-APC-6A1W]|nr:hypothetical protein [Rhodococcus sp. BL-253-APC-6A1W]